MEATIRDEDKSQEQLLLELADLRRQVAELQRAAAQHRLTEAALQENIELYQTLVDTSPDPIILTDLQANILFCNQQAATPEAYEGLKASLAEFLKTGQAPWANQVLERDYLHPDGRRLFVEGITSSIKIERGFMLMSVSRDVTGRVEAEQALRRYASRLEAMRQIDRGILNARKPEEIARIALDHLMTLAPCRCACVAEVEPGSQAVRILASRQRDRPEAGPACLRPLQMLDSQSFSRERFHRVADLRTLSAPSPFEQVLLDEGLCTYLHVPFIIQQETTGFLNLAADEPEAFSAEDLDIVQAVSNSLSIGIRQARLYQQTQQDAAAKALLLQEVNHRVKNNLASIIGMLYVSRRHALQANQTPCLATLDDLIGRLRGLATVHHLLSAAEWSPLPLSELADRVIQSILESLSLRNRVTTRIETTIPVLVSPDQANNLALLINELTTNVVKYALPQRETICLTVRIGRDNGLVTFEFQDDGPGFPQDALHLENGNVGLYLIEAITREGLRGELALRNDGGALVTVRFPASES